MVDIENFRIRLKQAIDYSGLSNNHITKAIGASNGYIGKILTGEHQPSIERIAKIIDALPDINPQWLIFGIGNMIDTNRTFSIPSSEKVAEKSSNDGSNDTKTKNSLILSEDQAQYQRMGNMVQMQGQELENLKREVTQLKSIIQMQENTIKAYESAIKAQEMTIETIKNAKFPTQMPVLEPSH